MSLTPGFRVPRGLLNKFDRDDLLLQDDVIVDRCFLNFAVSAYSPCD